MYLSIGQEENEDQLWWHLKVKSGSGGHRNALTLDIDRFTEHYTN